MAENQKTYVIAANDPLKNFADFNGKITYTYSDLEYFYNSHHIDRTQEASFDTIKEYIKDCGGILQEAS